MSNLRAGFQRLISSALQIGEADVLELFCESEAFPENFDMIIRGFRQHNIVSAIDAATGHGKI